MDLLFLISIAAAPTLPPWAELSVKTCISSMAFLASQAKASLSTGILMWNGSSPMLEGFQLNVGIFSIFFVSMLDRFANV